ncbi:helix-turn-helix domain-containing protein [Plastoroseomonas hellenica]|uniref:Helix-turn-helix transcriptional regulator n=1 Tax=Plastoroseomonas hellenica TaxID=2687306 RepID=A0ABS5ET19_9PROT|nr:helix-turn-helix transcriptional regulator [Plastoroseomonas hellenica]MBR0645055.1 helix-turn-helix transcriptional regulator [Plastoroseomonas hellenica]MBR0663427.1 helix-turn-helix transcriptional regulator [Plastoroseomonas hellenica]
MKFADIGQQLRSYRLESGLRAEEIAARLGVSRAALYRYEKGEVIKLDTIRRLAELLKISPLSLLGIGVEYFARPAGFQERLRQAEEQADQIMVLGGALCLQVATDGLEGAIAEAWAEMAEAGGERAQARAAADQLLGLIQARRRLHAQRRPTLTVLLGEGALRRLLAEGLCGGHRLSERVSLRCRHAARMEVEQLANLMESGPIGVQVGLIAGPEPSSPFLLLRGRERSHVVTGPFSPDAAPPGGTGVAMITAGEDAVSIHQRVTESTWRDSLKGPAAAERLRAILRETPL